MPTTEQLAAALRDVLPYAYSHALQLETSAEPNPKSYKDAAQAVQRCRAAADLLGSLAEPAVDMPPVMAKAKPQPDPARLLLIELLKWDTDTGGWESECWARARAFIERSA